MKKHSFVLVALLLAGMMAMPCVSAANRTNPTPPGWVGQFDEWAGQKDMSQYSNPTPPVPIHTMNVSTARFYPNMTVFRPAEHRVKSTCLFPFMRCDRFLTVMVVYNVNATRPDQPGSVVSFSLTGGPLQDPVYVSSAGTSDIFMQFDSLLKVAL